MKLKWYLIAIVSIISGWLGYNFGTIVERVNEYDILGKERDKAIVEYQKLRKVDRSKMTFVQKDSVSTLESWWLGYRKCIDTQRKRLQL